MGIDAMEIGVYLRKVLILSVRTFYRSAHKHPFVMGFVLFSFFLYRFLPLVFGFLVSSSPVLVCTFALLGTLLSYGHPNIPEVEEEKEDEKSRKIHHEISSLKAGVIEGDLVVQKDENFSVETHVEKEVEEKDWAFTPTRDHDLITERTSLIEKEPEDTHNQSKLIKEEGEFFNQEITEKSEFYDQEFLEKREFHEVKPLLQRVSDANSDDEDEVQSSFGRKKEIEPLIRIEETDENHAGELPPISTHLDLGDDPFGSAQDSSSWKKVEDHDDESFDSDSDGAESSSPDASMTDIMPMLDELHPLLDTEASQPAHISSLDSDAASERSHRSNNDNAESGEEVEHHEDEDDDDEEEEGQQENHEDGAKAVVTWTEDDEKNLMDLGNSELERNRRLESLIARRRARKNFRMMEAEKNMIDLDFNGPPFQIAPISTTRRNPFDIHYDSNMGMGLPPIPGSAPSVLLPRRNPFDLPYDPLEERPDLTGGSFNDEFMTPQEKDLHFRRHESFNLASFYFGEHKQQKQDKFKPYFVTEQMASEGVGYSRFQRQLSERSDSKVSSASETESHSSIVNQEDHRNLVEEQVSQEGEPITHVHHTHDHAKLETEYSKEVHFNEIEEEDKKDADLSRVEDEEDAHGTHSSFLNFEFIASPIDPDTSNVRVNPEVGEIKQHARSMSSSSSDVHEKIFEVNIDEELANLEPARGDIPEYSNSMQTMVVDSDLSRRVGEGAHDSQTKEPVYDLSPSPSERAISGMMNIEEAQCYKDKMVLTPTSSIASDMLVEVPEVGSTPVVVEETISLTHGESSLQIGSPRKEMTSAYERLWAPSPELCAIDENESTSTEITNISEHDVIEVGSSAVNQNSDHHVEFVLPSVVEQALFDSRSSSSESESDKESSLCEEASLLFEEEQVPPFSSNPEISAKVHQSDADEMVSSYSDGVSPKDLTSFTSEEQPLPMEKMMVQPSFAVDCEESQQELSCMPEISTKEVSVIDNVNELVFLEQKDDDLPNLPPLLSVPASLQPEVPGNQLYQMVLGGNFHDEIQYHSQCQVLGDLDFYQEAIRHHVTEEEIDEETEGIQEIDEALLTELDAVGDFSFEELETSANLRENQLAVAMHGSLSGLQVLEAKSSKDSEDDSDKLHKLDIIEEPQKPLESGCTSANVDQGSRHLELNKSTLELQNLDASSTKGIESTFKQLHDESVLQETEDGYDADFAPHTQEPNLIDMNLELPVLEAKSLEDIDSAFRQLLEGEVQKSVVPEPVHDESILKETISGSAESFKQLHDEPLSKEIEDDHAQFEPSTQEQNLIDTNLELPILEARSLEDIDSASMLLREGEADKAVILEPVHVESISDETEVGSPESFKQPHDELLKEIEDEHAEFKLPTQEPDLTETSLQLPVLEARSLEDMESAFKQLHGGEAEKSVVFEPIENESILEETTVKSFESLKEPLDEALLEEIEDEHAEFELPTQEPNLKETNLELPVIEARSLEDIDAAYKQLHEGEAEKSAGFEPVENESIVEETKVDSDESLKPPHDGPLSEEIEDEHAEFELPTQEPNMIEINLQLPVLEARSLEEIGSAFEQFHEGEAEKSIILQQVQDDSIPEETEVGSAESSMPHDEPLLKGTEDGHAKCALPSQEPNLIETDLEPPVLEARSLEDIDSVFKQLHEGDVENSIVHEPVHAESILEETKVGFVESFKQVHDEPLLKETEDGHVEFPICTPEPHLVETNLELPVLEVKSLEDIDSTYKQSYEGEAEKSVVHKPVHDEPILEQPKVGSVPNLGEVESAKIGGVPGTSDLNLELSVHEARSLEDIDSSFNDGGDDEKHTHESVKNRPQGMDPQDSTPRLSDLHVLEEHSEEVHLLEKQLSEGKMENQLKPYESETGSAEFFGKELESTEDITFRVEESVSQETETDLGESSSRKAGSKKKKAGSKKSSYSPSSSSSSSSSDSD